ncbi:DUF6221 family protein [Kineosporia sp. A_224]|uniref:DUF6221 family protein n=1 Tax=Kineosporia sp. A_224 TaxID=1962180 RepID=UPI000B4A6740|nr:DUF6221 family protein [Kineosporia sp. A_224]
MGHELVDFLRARLDEDEATVRSASPGPWWLVQNHFEGDNVVQVRSARTEGDAVHGQWTLVARFTAMPDTAITRLRMAADSVYFQAQNPVRALADVEARRAVVELCARTVCAAPGVEVTRRERRQAGAVLLALAAPYREHAGFRAEWEPQEEAAPEGFAQAAAEARAAEASAPAVPAAPAAAPRAPVAGVAPVG